MKKIILVLSFFIVMIMFGCSNKGNSDSTLNSQNKPYQLAFVAFDTNCAISLYEVDDAKGKAVGDKLMQIINAYESQMSKTKEGSDIYEINHRTGNSLMITDLTATLFDIAKGLYDWSDGRLDISAGTLIDLWDVKNRKTLPTKSEINEARKHCGNFNFEIERDVDPEYIKSHKITFYGDSKTQYDLGALVKGYCCESLKQIVVNEGVPACIINLGGNVCCVGKVSDRKDGAFNVGIFKPFSENEIIDTVKVVNRSVITSGVYQRYFKIDNDDKIYSHIIDPKIGYPVDNELYSVTIVSENGLLGDYLSTACMLMGTQNAMNLIDFCKKQFNDPNIQAIFVDKNNNITKYPKKVKLTK